MDQMLKQRLIGAIVLISLAVIFIPMILEGPDDELSPRTQDMPPPPTIDYQTEVELPLPAEPPVPTEAPAASVTEQEAAAIPEPSVMEPEPAATQPEPVKAATGVPPAVVKRPPPETPPKAALAPALPGGSWIIQAGSFSQQSNARSLRDRLNKSGYQAFLQDVKSADGPVYRVLIGPMKDRGAADKLRDKLAREQKLKAMVLQNKG
jgi:DedD protein